MSVEVGNIFEGKIAGITNFGAFVQLPDGNTGLVHISEVAEEYIRDIKSHLNENQIVKVKVLSVGNNGKISLSIKKAIDKSDNLQVVDNDKVGIVVPISGQVSFPDFKRPRPENRFGRFDRQDRNNRSAANSEPASFEDRLSRFMKDSGERMLDIKKNIESKRGSGRR